VPAQKKIWVYNGLIEQYPGNYLTTIHGSLGCTICHGGDDTASTRAAAHSATWKSIPGPGICSACHAAIVTASASSLHTTLGGYVKILGGRGFDFTGGAESKARFDAQCTKCHVANSSTQPACGFCHVSVPQIAGGGFLNGHNYRKTPDMERNCTACHGSRVKDEFFGLNNALIGRNGLGLASLQPDVHFAQTQVLNSSGFPKGCTFCHGGAEMHGQTAPAPAGSGDRFDVTGTPKCVDCHTSMVGANFLHSQGHLATMDCQICHAQAYKNCFGCHTDIDAGGTGLPFYRINEGDPTLAVRPEGSAPDALMTIRIGKNPRWIGTGDTENKKYAVLRHVPADKDVFRYPLAAPLDGLIPNMTARPMWKYATPHNIQRNSIGSTSVFASFNVVDCNNCHGNAYADHWLTDPIQDALGWLQPAYQADEQVANANVLQPAALPMVATP
jgi:thiosulfate/3-mercaptopyruvate sulfurtransferase